MSVCCPKCGNTDPKTIWEDNFWSGCDKCGWAASCENSVWIVPARSQSYVHHYPEDEPNEYD